MKFHPAASALSAFILLALFIAPTARAGVQQGVQSNSSQSSDDESQGETQSGAPKSTLDKAAAKRAEAERRKQKLAQAYALLEDAVTAARGLSLPDNRLGDEAFAIFLLWSHDEPRARSLAKDAMADVGELMRTAIEADEADPADPRYGESSRFETLYQTRAAMLSSIADRDPAFALELMRTNPIPSSPRTTDLADRELQMEGEFASRLVGKSPKEAMQIARECLEKGVVQSAFSLMSNLQHTNPEMASQLAAEIAKVLASQNFAQHPESVWIAINMLNMSLHPDQQGAFITADGQSVPLPPMLDATAARALATQLVSAATATPTNASEASVQQNILSQLQAIAPDISRTVPSLAQSLRPALSRLPRTAEFKDTAWESWNAIAQTGDVDAMLAAAEKADPTYRQNFFEQAAQYALAKGDADRARSIISSHVADASERTRVLGEIDQQSAATAVASQEAATSRAAIARVRSPGQRAILLAQLARSTVAKDRKLALSIADEATALLEDVPRNSAQFGERLNVGEAIAAVDAKRAKAVLSPAAERLNALVEASVVLDGFTCGSGTVKDGELRVRDSPVSNLGEMFATTLGSLAPNDFALARELTEQLDRSEVRVAVQLSLLRNVLPQFESEDEDEDEPKPGGDPDEDTGDSIGDRPVSKP